MENRKGKGGFPDEKTDFDFPDDGDIDSRRAWWMRWGCGTRFRGGSLPARPRNDFGRAAHGGTSGRSTRIRRFRKSNRNTSTPSASRFSRAKPRRRRSGSFWDYWAGLPADDPLVSPRYSDAASRTRTIEHTYPVLGGVGEDAGKGGKFSHPLAGPFGRICHPAHLQLPGGHHLPGGERPAVYRPG